MNQRKEAVLMSKFRSSEPLNNTLYYIGKSYKPCSVCIVANMYYPGKLVFAIYVLILPLTIFF